MNKDGSPSEAKWVVVKGGGQQVSVWHLSREAAEEEAKRLCGKEAAVFYVLEAISMVKPASTPVVLERYT